MFKQLAYGRATDTIPPADFKDIVLMIATMKAGYDVAVEMLSMRLHSHRERGEPIARELADAGCELLRQLNLATKNDQGDYQIGEIAKDCLTGEHGAAVATTLCARLRAAVTTYQTYAFCHDDLLDALFNAQPRAALDGLCGGDSEELDRGIRLLRDVEGRKRPLAVVSEADLLRWCDENPRSRYPALAIVINIIEQVRDNPPRWTSVALRFLERAPDPAAVLHQFVPQFVPSSGWMDSSVAILESNATLLDQLDKYPNLHDAVAQEKERLQGWIKEQRGRQTASDRVRDERFE
jgi:hypothetical protein